MYSTSEDELDAATKSIIKEKQKYPEFVNRFEKFYQRKHEWILYFRKDLLTRQNNTNNMAEITIRILKDIVLCRTKAFNVVALVEFCISVWEMYLIKKLLDYAYGRKNEVHILYSSLLKKNINFTEDDVEEISTDIFLIRSKKNIYTVNANIGACSCPAGVSGAFCKHQCFLMNFKNIRFHNSPPILQDDRYDLGYLALGDKCPEKSFFSDFLNSERENEREINVINNFDSPNHDLEIEEEKCKVLTVSKSITDEQKEKLHEEFDRLSELTKEMNRESAESLINSIKKIKTIDDLQNTFLSKSFTPKSKKIKVQPTAISRRKALVKSSKKLPSGRPPTSTLKKCLKKKRNLSENIKKNLPNAKSHGTSH